MLALTLSATEQQVFDIEHLLPPKQNNQFTNSTLGFWPKKWIALTMIGNDVQIALLTVSWQAIRAAVANPVDALRDR